MMADSERARAERRATVTAMRRRQSSHGAGCGYDPTVTVEISPHTRRTVRIILLVLLLLAAVAFSIVLLVAR